MAADRKIDIPTEQLRELQAALKDNPDYQGYINDEATKLAAAYDIYRARFLDLFSLCTPERGETDKDQLVVVTLCESESVATGKGFDVLEVEHKNYSADESSKEGSYFEVRFFFGSYHQPGFLMPNGRNLHFGDRRRILQKSGTEVRDRQSLEVMLMYHTPRLEAAEQFFAMLDDCSVVPPDATTAKPSAAN